MLFRYWKIWLRLTASAFQVALISRFGAILFTLGKILRFIFFLMVLYMIVTKTNTLAGYTLTQTFVFYLTFNLIDTLTQLLFRDVYRFRFLIVSGDFDLILIKPINPLFRILLGGADPMDLLISIPYIILLIIFLLKVKFTFIALLTYVLLIVNGMFISTAFHIFVLALGILTTEIDHVIMIYRDISEMVRFPLDIYREPLRGLITFVIPVGIMMSFPPKALFGSLSVPLILIAFVIGILFLILSYRLWRFALSKYTSASS